MLKRAASPHHLRHALRLQRNRRKIQTAYDDPQLKLYAQILPQGFLHYGFFDDTQIQPQNISLSTLR